MAKTLIIVDMQKGFIPEESQNKIKKIAEKKDFFDKIIYYHFKNPKKNFSKLNWDPKEEDLRMYQEIIAISDFIIPKSTYSITTSFIEKEDHIFLCGAEASACVLASAFHLFDKGYNFKIIKDLCFDKNFDNKVMLNILERNFNNLVSEGNIKKCK